MHLVRRSAFKAASAAAAPSSALSRGFVSTTSSSYFLRAKAQGQAAVGFANAKSAFRSYSDDSAPSDSDTGGFTVSREESGGYDNQRSGGGRGRGGYDNVGRGRGGFDGGRSFTPRGRGGYEGGRGGFTPRPRGGYDAGRGGSGPREFNRPPPEVFPNENVYVGNLLFDVTESDLEREFAEFGTIHKVFIARDARQLSKGYAYIEFANTAEATAAVEAKHQAVMEGRYLVVNFARKREPRADTPSNPPSKTLFVGNLAFEMSDADLNKLFRDIRNVTDVRVAIDRRTGQPRGFAHADFVDVESAVKGMEQLKDEQVYGRKLRLDFSFNKDHVGDRRDRGESDSGSAY
ncbi:hypothetical protein BJ875DRAFT_461776 [Amylocarpus encephaloides]|uniref:RRM domain-containing protein n=1 Tax=Amylocarpus encephaloides TaxID=45428 RepID=A0A9P7YIR1_9HELO|nr:hypothetical protein BJ875DRAFT_461776 [Amylocarpus encephaloides]